MGAAAAPIAIPLLLASIINMLGGGMDVTDMVTGGRMEPWLAFRANLNQTLGVESDALKRLHDALPYVQSQEELGQLLNTLRRTVGDRVGGYGAGQDLYTVPALPGAGGSSHEGGQVMDYGPAVNYINGLVSQLGQSLPGQRITDPDAVLSGADRLRLWTQFGDRVNEFPIYLPTATPDQIIPGPGGEGGSTYTFIPGTPAGYYPYSPETGMGFIPNGGLRYGAPGYDYAGAGLPLPGQNLGTISAAWQALMNPAAAMTTQVAPVTPTPSSATVPAASSVRRSADP
jgi:hypothetical protein